MTSLSRRKTAGGSIFAPPESKAARNRRKQKAAALAASAAIVLALIGFGVDKLVAGPAGPVLCTQSAPPFQVINDGGECVGVTDGSFVFDPGSAPVDQGIAQAEHDIATENAQVVRSGNYVTVALLIPITWSVQSVVSLERIRNELEGAYAAQYAANALQDVNPRIRLVLANEGSVEQAWQQVVGELTQLTATPGRLVAVIGMGISVTATVDAARTFSAAHIPMIGSVITGDPLDWSHIPGLARVALTSKEEVVRLAAYFTKHGGLGPAFFLVSDSDSHDLYTSGLRDDFEGAFHIGGIEPYGPGPDIGNEFNLIADEVCGLSGPPPTIIYAGREVVLPDFIQQLQGSPSCNRRQLTVVTGSDAEGLDPRSTTVQPGNSQQPNPAKVSVIYAGLVNQDEVTAAFRSLFTSTFGDVGLDDPWMIETNNAMAAAAKAIALAAGSSSQPPGPQAVMDAIPLLNGPHMVQGATGAFAIGLDGNEMSPHIPIFEISAGARQLLSP